MLKRTGIFFARSVRLITFVVAALAFGTIAYYGFIRGNENVTLVKLNFDAPTAMTFADNNSAIINDDIPDTNNNRKFIGPNPLVISYIPSSGPGNPPLKHLEPREIAQNVRITPAVRGNWKMYNPFEIRFIPEQDWTAGTKFTVKILPGLFNSDVQPNKTKFSFKTEPVTAILDSMNIYPVAGGGRSVIGAAVISFTNPIKTKDFEHKVAMRLDGERVDFKVKFDQYGRTAIITTAPITVLDKPQTLRFKLNRVDDLYGKSSSDKITANIGIPAIDNFFKLKDIETITADDQRGNPQQLILLNFSAAARSDTDWSKYVHAYLLPKYATAEEDEDNTPHIWATDEVSSGVIKKSIKLSLTPVNFTNPAGTYQYAFSYRVSDDVPRYVYVSVDAGIVSSNDFTTKNSVARAISVTYPERSVRVAGTGALLSLAGDKELGIVARGGVENAYVNLYKVESREINHLITQTYNLFSDLTFKESWVFNAYDMTSVFRKKIPFSDTSVNKVNYASVNLGEYLDRTYKDKTGIFIVKTGASEYDAEYNDARLILLTDLGIIRKIGIGGTGMVFVSHLSNGRPAADIDVRVLGRNGNPIWAGVTNADGAINIPAFPWSEYKNEKEPVAIVAQHENDVSFIPYNADEEQRAEYSRFDIGGVYASNTTPLNGFIFSDRGIYRPGESLVLGTIVKNKEFTSVAGIPVKIEITDARGNTIFDKKVSLSADGMFDIIHNLGTDAPIGKYTVNLYSLNGRGRVQDTIGTTNFQVQEFTPDTMKIIANINELPENGWILPNKISANVSLNNLYGTPATDRKISATALLRPINFSFDAYSDYKFNTNSVSGAISENSVRAGQTFSLTSPDTRTDDEGNATITINFDHEIPMGTYLLTLEINGFDGGDGKSIKTVLNSRVSNFDYLIGYHTHTDLSYIKRNSDQIVNLVAIDQNGTTIDAKDLTVRLVKRENLTSLIKDYENHYKYQTISRDVIVQEKLINISKSGTDLKLNTKNGGTYYLQISDKNGNILTSLEYFVASTENTELNTDTRAELQIKLDAHEYAPGETVNIGITAPYTGSGLITIERDKVYAYKWFNAQTTSSTQQITIPNDFEGTGYINVSFVRNINSRDIFTTPYTYAIAPFTTKLDQRRVNISMDTPKVIRDNKLDITYSVNRDSRVMIFAVNTGILQVAKYKTPNPITHFFQKAALQVETYQILSLLLPEYKILRQLAAPGGSDFDGDLGGLDTPMTNPFARKNLPPVAFYSGILDAKSNVENNISFDIPEYFNGSLTIFAIAATPDAFGATSDETHVQSPVILSVSAPTFVAPNDKFTVNTVISNLTEKSGAAATARSNANTTGGLKILNQNDTIMVPENTERLWTFDVNAGDKLGTADINVSTTLFDEDENALASRKSISNLSVRPAAAIQTRIQTGTLDSKTKTLKTKTSNLYPEQTTKTLIVSSSPSVLIRPMFMYLKDYDFSCTEQLVSRTTPYVLMPEDRVLGTTATKSREIVNDAIRKLANRQNDDGSFNLWTGGTHSNENISDFDTAYLTAYVMNFLTFARRGGFTVPQSMFSRGIDFLRSHSDQDSTSDDDALARAFAVYVISENDYVTTSYLDMLQDYLDNNMPKWRNGPIGLYISASYKMLKQTDKAYNIFTKYQPNESNCDGFKTIFCDSVANDAIHAYIGQKYFGTTEKSIPESIQKYINAGHYGSFTAAAIVSGFVGTSDTSNKIKDMGISVSNGDTNIEQNKAEDNLVMFNIPYDTENIKITCANCKSKDAPFYSLIIGGFPKSVHATSNGLEINRKYYDANGNEITGGKIGDTVNVKITVRTRGGTDHVSNAVISDLLPGGFIPSAETLAGNMDFSEVREDRILIYADITRTPSVYTYSAQLSVAGEFTVPPITVSDMYNPSINATGDTETFTVSNANN